MIPRWTLNAAQIQPRDDAARLTAEQSEAGLARAIRASYDALIASVDPAHLARMLESARFAEFWRHLALERLGGVLRPALNRLARVHDASAIEAAAALPAPAAEVIKAAPSRLRTPAVIHLTYDPLNAATVAAQNASNQQLVQAVVDNAQAGASQVLSDALSAGRNPRVIAQQLRETLGLSPAEARAVETYRAALEGGTAAPLQRALRDRRFDARVRRGDLTPEQIDQMTERYASRYRAFRALRIARTEALRAANQGRAAAWRQYAERSGIGPGGIRRFWLTAGDELVCPVCAAIPGLNPNGVGLDEAYQTPRGEMMAPPDPHPNCRCSERFSAPTASEQSAPGTTSDVGIRVELDYGQN